MIHFLQKAFCHLITWLISYRKLSVIWLHDSFLTETFLSCHYMTHFHQKSLLSHYMTCKWLISHKKLSVMAHFPAERFLSSQSVSAYFVTLCHISLFDYFISFLFIFLGKHREIWGDRTSLGECSEQHVPGEHFMGDRKIQSRQSKVSWRKSM